MPTHVYAKWIAPAILFFFLCVALGYWTHKLHHPTPSVGVPTQK